MKRLRNAGWVICAVGVVGITPLIYAQQTSRPEPTFREAIDESRLVTLQGNTRPEATARNDRGIVSDDLPMEHMLLQLKRSSEREAALKQYIDELHDKTSPNFHHWLTP